MDMLNALAHRLGCICPIQSAGDSVRLLGFGMFERKERTGRTGRNPKTREPVFKAASTIA